MNSVKRKALREIALNILLPIGFGVIVYISWETQLIHTLLNIDIFTLPVPSRIGVIISENAQKIGENLIASLQVAVLGLIFGSGFGYLVAIIAALFKRIGVGGLTVVSAFNAIPIVALAPVITNWTRDVSSDAEVRSFVAKVIVVTIVCTAAMSVNAYRGLTELKPFSEDLMKSYAANKFTFFLKLRLPNSIPYIFTALRVSVPASVIGALVSEYFAEYRIGVGRQIRENILIAQYATAWAYIIVACAMGIALYILLIIFENIFLKKPK